MASSTASTLGGFYPDGRYTCQIVDNAVVAIWKEKVKEKEGSGGNLGGDKGEGDKGDKGKDEGDKNDDPNKNDDKDDGNDEGDAEPVWGSVFGIAFCIQRFCLLRFGG